MSSIRVYYGDETELLPLPTDRVRTSEEHTPRQSRFWMRKLLAQELSIPVQELAFTYGENGKPALAGHPISFNLTHTRTAFALAVSLDLPAIGIDIEYSGRQLRNPADFAKACLDPATLEQWQQLPVPEQATHLLRHWVRREATVKASGAGLAEGWSGTLPANRDALPIEERISCAHYQLGAYYLALAWPAASNEKPTVSWRALGSEWPVLTP